MHWQLQNNGGDLEKGTFQDNPTYVTSQETSSGGGLILTIESAKPNNGGNKVPYS